MNYKNCIFYIIEYGNVKSYLKCFSTPGIVAIIMGYTDSMLRGGGYNAPMGIPLSCFLSFFLNNKTDKAGS